MNHLRKSSLFVIAVLFAALALSAVTVSAEPANATVTLSEAQINSSFRVTNPAYRRLTNVRVDLQPGQASVSATLTVRTPRGQTTTVYQTVSTWIPSIVNGRILWTLSSATVNGSPASSQMISQINAAIGASWRAYWRGQHPGRATTITVDDNQVVITYN
ncbi:MAG: hypothetical protein JNL34_17525 [Anaerolineae bacterium]|nr:hypothetical protein [Anaerolineae bacterium]